LNRDRFNNKIVTTIEYNDNFWIAEEYHQKYLKKKKFNFFSK
jgi:peptide methionine sulfoxide reductase MsrA